MLHLASQRIHHAGAVFALHPDQHDEARVAFDKGDDLRVMRADEQIAFPMSGDGAIFHFGRTLPDRDRIHDASGLSFGGGRPRSADPPARTKVGHQIFLERAAGLDEQAAIDRFMGHPQSLIMRILLLKPACDLLGRPALGQAPGHRLAQCRPLQQNAGFGP